MTSLPGSFNPSDYEFLLKSLQQGNLQTKAESLKRFITLTSTDKKQFSGYAKRVVVCIQDLLLQPREDINLLASTLALEIINLNPREIQYYVKTKLLKNIVRNLGDSKPQIRKTSHYCLLSYVKTYKSFDELLSHYVMEGLYSDLWQLKQKSINSFQSILIMQVKHLNWNTNEFKRLFELLIDKLNDESPYVQKAAEQCLISLSKIDNVRLFSKKLSTEYFSLLRSFMENQKKNGAIQEIKLDIETPKPSPKFALQSIESKTLSSAGQSLLAFQKPKFEGQSFQLIPLTHLQNSTRKKQIRQRYTPAPREQKRIQPEPQQEIEQQAHLRDMQLQQPSNASIPQSIAIMSQLDRQKNETLQGVFGKKVLEDLKNERDWKIRSDAMDEIARKYKENKEKPEMEAVTKSLLPLLMKILGDNNFKISLTALKVIQQIFQNPSFSLDTYLPAFIERLADSKIGIRQNIAKIIKTQFSKTKKIFWIDNLLLSLKKTTNTNCKQEILNLLYKFYEEGEIGQYPLEKILNEICPMMQDLKTKIKIKTLDCLVMVTLRSNSLQTSKSIISSSINQVYYEMFIDKLNKELKTGKWNHEISHFSNTELLKKKNPTKNIRVNKVDSTAASSKLHTSFSKDNYIELEMQESVDTKNVVESVDKKRKYSSGQDLQYKKAIYSTTPIAALLNEKTPIKNTSLHKQLRKATINSSTHDQYMYNSEDQKSEKSEKSVIIKAFRKKMLKSNFESKTTEYTAKELLEPFESSEKQFKLMMEELKSDDWQISFEALNKLRRIIENHTQLLVPPHIHNIVQQVIKLVESLRSSLSKNAMITLNELTTKIKRMLDPELDFIFGKLIKKTMDTNSFIIEEVKKALLSLCMNSNEGKIVGLLGNYHQTKSFPVKQSICYILENISTMPKYLEKDADKIVSILVAFLNEGSLEIRERTKKVILQLLESNKSSQIIRMIPGDQLAKIRKKEPVKEEQPPETIKIEEPVIELPIKRRNQKITVFPKEFQQLDALLQKCENSDWKLRVEGMNEIGDLCSRFPAEMAQYKHNSKVVDILSKQISDPNIKVATNALSIFLAVSSEIPSLIENNLSVVTNEIFNCFGSNKQEIRNQAQLLFDSIANNIETWMLFQHVCNGAIYGIQKARPVIIQKLIEISDRVYQKKPLIYTKNIYNTLNKLLDDTKSDIIAMIPKVARSCQDLVGGEVFSNTKSKIKEFIS